MGIIMLDFSIVFLIPKAVSTKLFAVFEKQCSIGYRAKIGHILVNSNMSYHYLS